MHRSRCCSHAFASTTTTRTHAQPKLMREKHIDYLKRGLLLLSSGFVALDARCVLLHTSSSHTLLSLV